MSFPGYDELTRRQREIYDWLLQQAAAGRPPPSLTEICRALGLRSRGSLHKHVQALVEQGLIEPMQGLRRGVRLREVEVGSERALPLLGYVAAGRPIEAIESTETVEVPAWLRSRRPCYLLHVRGDSMLEEGILDGDRIVVEQREHARNGEVVVALIDGDSATLKRIEQRPGQCILYPANPAHDPQHYHPDRVTIQGILIAVLRRY